MRELSTIIATSVKNNIRLKAVASVLAVAILPCAAGTAALFCAVTIGPLMRQVAPNRSELELYLGLIMYTSCLMGMGINLTVFAFQSMTREKARGSIESLLATPLKATDVWLAKSLAVFFVGLALGLSFALVSLVAVNLIYFVPRIGFVVNPWILVNSFVVVPLIYLFLNLLVHLIGLTSKPATGNVISQVFLPLYLTLMINLATRNVIDAASWPFTVANLGTAAIAGITVLLLRSRLTRERMVLSR